MIEDSADYYLYGCCLSTAFGFIIGEAFGDSRRYRKCLEEANADLRDQLQNAPPCTPTLQCELDQQRKVINNIHKRVVAVSKGLEKPAR